MNARGYVRRTRIGWELEIIMDVERAHFTGEGITDSKSIAVSS